MSLVGNGFFVLVAVILPFVQEPRYHVARDAVSILALGKSGWLQNVAFCAAGVGTISLAMALWLGTSERVGAALLGVAGAINFLAAGFHTVHVGQPQTTASTVHNVGGVVTFLLTVVAMVLFSRSFRKEASWKSLARPTLFWAIVACAALVLSAPPVIGKNHFGITERILLAALYSWMLFSGIKAATTPRP